MVEGAATDEADPTLPLTRRFRHAARDLDRLSDSLVKARLVALFADRRDFGRALAVFCLVHERLESCLDKSAKNKSEGGGGEGLRRPGALCSAVPAAGAAPRLNNPAARALLAGRRQADAGGVAAGVQGSSLQAGPAVLPWVGGSVGGWAGGSGLAVAAHSPHWPAASLNTRYDCRPRHAINAHAGTTGAPASRRRARSCRPTWTTSRSCSAGRSCCWRTPTRRCARGGRLLI